MYHEEAPARRSARKDLGPVAEKSPTGPFIGVGGGVSLAIAAEMLARPILPAIYDLAAILPLVVTSASILFRRVFGGAIGSANSTRSPFGPARPPFFRGPHARHSRVSARPVGDRHLG